MTFLTKLTRLRDAATKEKCVVARVNPESAADDFYEPYAAWIAGAFPRYVQVGRSACVAADDMALIAHLRNHADALAELVRAASNVSDTLNGGQCVCEHCGNSTGTTDFDFADDLREALRKLDGQKEK